MIIELKGTPNIGNSKEETRKYEIETTQSNILIKDANGEVLISYAPFFDGGSVWISDFPSIIMDREYWGNNENGEYKMLRKESQAISNVSVAEIMKWKEDSEKLTKIKEAHAFLKEV